MVQPNINIPTIIKYNPSNLSILQANLKLHLYLIQIGHKIGYSFNRIECIIRRPYWYLLHLAKWAKDWKCEV